MDSVPYELLAKIFKIYVSLQDPWPETKDPFPETLLNTCRWWRAVARAESTLWTRFVISRVQTVASVIESPTGYYHSTNYTLTRDWVRIFEKRLELAGPSLPLQISILHLNTAILPVIDVISGQAPYYVHLPRWETLDFMTGELIRHNDPTSFGSIADLISQPMPSLKCLTLQQNKIDFHAFPAAPHLEELNNLYSRSPCIGRNNSFPILKRVKITYPSKYPLSLIDLSRFSLRTIETLIIEGEVEVGSRMRGGYPSLSTLEFTKRVPSAIISMSAPNLRHLILHHPDLFAIEYPPPQQASYASNREVLEMLARAFPTLTVLDIHPNLISLIQDLVSHQVMFANLKELWTVSRSGRERVDLF